MENILLNILYVILLAHILLNWVKRLRATKNKREVIGSTDATLFITLMIIGFGPLIILNIGLKKEFVGIIVRDSWQWLISAVLSLLISGIWLMYIRKIDIFEAEKWKHIIATFMMGAVFSFLAPLGYLYLDSLGFILNGKPLNDLLYSIFAIGGIEELVKFIPVFVMLNFTGAVDEPYDYILYGSVSALGFAFVENTMYIYQSGLFNIGGRALYASVAHMVDASIIGYGLMITKYQFNNRNLIPRFLLFFFLAMLAHGFYDFWLINDLVSRLSILTVLFFLASIHIWFIFKNNAVNISNYYDPAIKLDNDKLKSYLMISLVSLLILGYVIVSLVYGMEYGNRFLLHEWVAFGYLVLYIAMSFSRYKVIRGRLQRFRIPLDFFIPKPIKAEESKK